jgi:hypothetical protein
MGNGRYNQRDQPSPALHQQRPNSIPETIRLINRPNPLHLSVLLPGGHIDFFNHNLWLWYVGLQLKKQGRNWTCAIHPDDVEAIGFDLI